MKRLIFLTVFCLLLIPVTLRAQSYILILNKAENTAWQLDAQTGDKVAEYKTGSGPHEVAISPDERLAVITNYGDNTPGSSLTVLNLDRKQVIKTIELNSLERPHGVAWFSDGRRVIISAEGKQAVAIVDIEKDSVLSVIPTGEEVSHMVVLGSDEKYAYVPNLGSGSVSVLDLSNQQAVRTIPADNGTEGITLANEGKELWVTNRGSDTIFVIDTGTLEVADTLNSPSFPIRAEASPDGKYIAVSNAQSSNISIFEAESHKLLTTVSTLTEGTNNGIPIGLTFSSDGGRLFVANSNANEVVVIDTSDWKVIDTFRTGTTPDGIAFFTLD